ncbi:aminotransferase class I/II-fold pyridoxal phosphate-dependent enzyme [Tissierella creatinini]|nr:aminotransferase class I/II-fold pyridoxal phosphate-dependent enzyme [Tissierella creatinini]TJX65608.1 aminotransferase class I/II-fold pyridoxal phosphate-dependent enzyme [Soehngenia saccharolytica]
MKHGGDLLTYENQYDGELIDFSSNINPLGPPNGLNEVLIKSFKEMTTYPDIKYRKLKTSISNYLNCPIENVLVGNGAVEIINNFIIRAKNVIVCTPSFIEYEERAIAHGKQVRKIPYKKDYTIDIEALKNIKENELLILGNPNNPTGFRIPQDDLINIYNLVRKAEAFLLLDEAFYEFCPKDYDSIEIFKKYDYEGVGIIRAATKFFALPGIRLGYGCTCVEKVREISKIELPWSVNTLADAAGQYIFSHKEYINKSKDYIAIERKFLFEELSKIVGIQPYITHTNYILIKLEKWDEEYVFNFLLKRGLVIRKCSSFKDLDDKHIRVAIKDRANNVRLVEALKEL